MSIRNFKLWNADRTSSFDLSQTGITVTSPKGFGNKFSNTIQSGNRSRKYLTDQKNDFEDISFKVLFGLKAKNAYDMYHQLATFIQDNQRNEMVLEYTRNSETLYVDVALKQFTKTEKSQFNVLEESITFERLSPFYSIVQTTSKSVLVQNRYIENILPKITLKDTSINGAFNIKVSSANIAPTFQDFPVKVNGVTISKTKSGTYILNGESTASSWLIQYLYDLQEANEYLGYMRYAKSLSGNYDGSLRISGGSDMWLPANIGQETRGIVTEDSREYIGLYMNSGTKFNNYEVEIQLSKVNSNDVSRNDLNGLTRNEIFIDNNLVINGDFSIDSDDDGLPDYWEKNSNVAISNLDNGVLSVTTDTEGSVGWLKQLVQLPDYEDKVYIRVESKISEKISTYPMARVVYRTDIGAWITSEYLYNLDFIVDIIHINTPSGTKQIEFAILTDIIGTYAYLKDAIMISLTDLNLTDKSKEQLNEHYNQYKDPQPLDYTPPTDYTQSLIINATLNDYDELVIDSESKEITLNNENAYDLLDKANDTFIVVPPGDYVIEADQEITVEYKKWVID